MALPGDTLAYVRGEPLDVGTRTMLLLDDTFVEDRWGVRRHVNQPVRHPHNPLLMSDQPWEDRIAQPSVIYDDDAGLFRMWYTVLDAEAHTHQFEMNDWSMAEHGMPYFPCYAESGDGVHWTKPHLDDKPYRDYPATNVIMQGVQKVQAARVTSNHETTGQPGRFMMTYKDNLPEGYGCMCLAYSDDGLHWRPDPRNPFHKRARDTWVNIIYDDLRERWLMYTRPCVTAGLRDIADHPEVNFKRRVSVCVGDTPFDFSSPRTLLWPDECDAANFDHMPVCRVGHHFIGFLAHMETLPHQRFDTHLAFSADGLRWQQMPTRRPWLPWGEAGTWDGGYAAAIGSIVERKDRMWFYYRGMSHGQGTRDGIGGIGCCMINKDRFIAQFGEATGGFLLTREMRVATPTLSLNCTLASPQNTDEASCMTRPQFAVEVLAREGDGEPKPIPGYTRDESLAQPCDLIDCRPKWRDKGDLSELVGKSVYFRFYLRNVGLYAMRFVDVNG